MYVKGNIFAVPMFTPNLSGINFLLDFLVPISQTYNEKEERGLVCGAIGNDGSIAT